MTTPDDATTLTLLPDPAPLGAVSLQVRSGPGAGTVHLLDEGDHVLGRSSVAGVRVTGSGVSRIHARIFVGDEVTIEDLGATNGVLVDGIAVSKATLRDGALVALGSVEVVLRRGEDALSAREREVAEAVSEGLTNGEIGRRLFISRRTVSTHLVNIYKRLGIGSRAELTRYLVERR